MCPLRGYQLRGDWAGGVGRSPVGRFAPHGPAGDGIAAVLPCLEAAGAEHGALHALRLTGQPLRPGLDCRGGRAGHQFGLHERHTGAAALRMIQRSRLIESMLGAVHRNT